jgi:hypothetical protein
MRTLTVTGMIVTAGLLIAASFALAQRPGGGPRPSDADDLVSRMMEFDKDQDQKLTKAEVTDARLHRLFDRADADKDGVVTREELTALAAREAANGRGGPRGGGGGPPGGFPGGGPMGMGPPRPGEILPPMLQDRLELTSEQKAQLAALQKEVDSKLESILNDDQKAQLKTMRERGPGRFGPPGGGRGPGPGGDGPPPRREPR